MSVRVCVRLLQRFDPKMDHFRVTQNGSIPREGPLETVQKWTHFEQNDPLFGPFLTALHEGWNCFEDPENELFLGKSLSLRIKTS